MTVNCLSIEDAQLIHGAPARKILRRSPKRCTGALGFSHLSSREIEWESMLEQNAYYLVAACPNIAQIDTQPVLIKFLTNDGKEHHGFPDARIREASGDEIYVEIKPVAKASEPETYERLLLVKKAFAYLGLRYAVLTDEVIEAQPRLKNARFAARYFREELEPALIESLVAKCAQQPMRSPELAEAMSCPIQKVYAAIAHHHLWIPHFDELERDLVFADKGTNPLSLDKLINDQVTFWNGRLA